MLHSSLLMFYCCCHVATLVAVYFGPNEEVEWIYIGFACCFFVQLTHFTMQILSPFVVWSCLASSHHYPPPPTPSLPPAGMSKDSCSLCPHLDFCRHICQGVRYWHHLFLPAHLDHTHTLANAARHYCRQTHGRHDHLFGAIVAQIRSE
jgi:hypothetical protein